MAKNIKYIRWAAMAFRFILVINVILGLIAFITATFVVTVSSVERPFTIPMGISINFGALITIGINAFITYTAARGLELFADVAERVEVIRRNLSEQATGIRQQFPNG